MITPADYLDFARREYLQDFVRRGGAAVKFAVRSESGQTAHFVRNLAAAAKDNGYLYASVDAADTRAHMIDQLFFAVARQVDWDAMARSFVHGALTEIGFPVPAEMARPTLAGLARHFEYDVAELSRDLNRKLQESLLDDYAMAQEFRIAMLRLCQTSVSTDELDRAGHDVIIEWLTGDLRHVTRLRSARIFQRIARHNARHMLYSLAHWATRNDYEGLVLHLDITRCAVIRRPPPDQAVGVYYSKAMVIDTYEVLRQLIDGTDELSSCFVLVTAAPEFLTDEARGLAAYTALQMRISDDVRDRRRDNPFASLVRLGVES